MNLSLIGSQHSDFIGELDSMAVALNRRFVPTLEELHHVSGQSCDRIARDQKERCLYQVAETIRFRLEMKPLLALIRGEMYVRQTMVRGDDLCMFLVIPSIRLYRFQVANILGEVQETLHRRYGIYVHHSDLTMEQGDGNPVNRGYNLLDVVFSSLSSTRWAQNFSESYKICHLLLTFAPKIEALSMEEDFHLNSM